MECWCVGGLVDRDQDRAPDNSWIKLHPTSHRPRDENDDKNIVESDNQKYESFVYTVWTSKRLSVRVYVRHTFCLRR